MLCTWPTSSLLLTRTNIVINRFIYVIKRFAANYSLGRKSSATETRAWFTQTDKQRSLVELFVVLRVRRTQFVRRVRRDDGAEGMHVAGGMESREVRVHEGRNPR